MKKRSSKENQSREQRFNNIPNTSTPILRVSESPWRKFFSSNSTPKAPSLRPREICTQKATPTFLQRPPCLCASVVKKHFTQATTIPRNLSRSFNRRACPWHYAEKVPCTQSARKSTLRVPLRCISICVPCDNLHSYLHAEGVLFTPWKVGTRRATPHFLNSLRVSVPPW